MRTGIAVRLFPDQQDLILELTGKLPPGSSALRIADVIAEIAEQILRAREDPWEDDKKPE